MISISDLLETVIRDQDVQVTSVSNEGDFALVEFASRTFNQSFAIPCEAKKLYALLSKYYSNKPKVVFKDPSGNKKFDVHENDIKVKVIDEEPLRCKDHPNYRGLRRTKNGCETCQKIYHAQGKR